jgi:hypothetical protein
MAFQIGSTGDETAGTGGADGKHGQDRGFGDGWSLLHGARDEEALDSVDDAVGLGDGGVADAHRGAVAALRGSRSGELDLLAGERLRGNEDCPLALHNLLLEVYENKWDMVMVDAPKGYFAAAFMEKRRRSTNWMPLSWRIPTPVDAKLAPTSSFLPRAAGSGTAAGAVS